MPGVRPGPGRRRRRTGAARIERAAPSRPRHSGAAGARAVEAGAAEAGTCRTGAAEAGTSGAGAAKAGPVEAGAVEAGAVEGGAAETGAVTVEAAIVLLGLALVLALLAWFVVVLGAQLRAVDAARAGARLAARAQPYADLRDEVHRIAPGVSVSVDHDASAGGERVVVTVRQRISPPGPLAGIGAIEVGGRATAWVEVP